MVHRAHGAHGGRLRPRKRFGQHFLEPAWAEKLVQAIAPREGESFIEIGPGHGVLTRRLAEAGATVRAIEIDRDLASRLATDVPQSVTVVNADFLALDASDVLGGLAHARVAGNLPFNISSPILFRLLDLQRTTGALADATLMLQREVADRVLAEPNCREYGPLAIFVGLHADRARVLSLPPGAFRPMPKVHSAVVRLAFRPARIAISDMAAFDRLVRIIFQQRRKTLANALRPLANSTGLDAASVLTAAQLDGRRRPETLQLEELSALGEALRAAGRARSVL